MSIVNVVLRYWFEHFYQASISGNRADDGEKYNESSYLVHFALAQFSLVCFEVEETGEDEGEQRASECALEIYELAQIGYRIGDEAAHHSQTQSDHDRLHSIVKA